MNERQREEFAREMECNLSISVPGPSRSRIYVYVQSGTRTFDWALFERYNEGLIGFDEALRNADPADELRLPVKLKSRHGSRRQALNAVRTSSGGHCAASATPARLQLQFQPQLPVRIARADIA